MKPKSALYMLVAAPYIYFVVVISFLQLYLINAGNNDVEGPKINALASRDDLGKILERHNFTVGVELGVQNGIYSNIILKEWKSCKQYVLVDVWRSLTNYVDVANFNDKQQELIYETAMKTLRPYGDKITVKRNLTTSAALDFPDKHFDFIYVDARHDYCGALDDIKTWWPKLKRGGIMAGHDYITAAEHKKYQSHDDWGLCGDGVTRNELAVVGAVNEFAKQKSLRVFTTLSDGPWVSWIFPPKHEHSH